MTNEYQEISTSKLSKTSEEYMSNNDMKLANFYLNLIKYSNKPDSIGVKIDTMLGLSIIYSNNKDENNLIILGRKILKYSEELDYQRYNQETLVKILHIILNIVNVLEKSENEKDLFAALFLYLAKNIFTISKMKNDEINQIIKNTFPNLIKRLNDIYFNIRIDCKEKKSNLLKIKENIDSLLNTKQKNNDILIKKNDSVFLVNTVWLKQLLNFIDVFTKAKDKDTEKYFSANSIVLSIYENNNYNDNEELKGSYCGPINNFKFSKSKRFWEDPLKKYTNSYIVKNLHFKKDYEIINKDIYEIINFYFKNNYEIERMCIKDITNLNNIIDIEDYIELNLYNIHLLFLNENMRDIAKEHLIPKNIQISLNENIEELNNKIERIFLNFAKDKNFNDYDYEYKSFLLKFDKKLIMDIIISYSNFNKTFKIEGENLYEKDKNLLISELLNINSNNEENNKNNNKYIIICEPISKNSIVKPFLVKKTSNFYCTLCNFTIESKEKIIHCPHCSHSIYCSEACKNNDHSHIEFHKKIFNLYDMTLNKNEIEKINIESFLDSQSLHGLVGIKNSSGLDFLNASIQCLSHCIILTKYFLSNDKKKDLESLCGQYTDVLRKLWIENEKEININNFKVLFFSMIKELANISTIDAFDIFVVLLDKLHSELNQVKNKPEDIFYFEQEKGESDDQASKRWWKTHKLMNQSIIIDLFQGQLKMKVRCSFCKTVTITYPPFLYLALPIPDADECTKVSFRLFPYDKEYNYHYINVELYDVNKFTSIKDIKKRIREFKLFKNSKNKIVAVLYKDCELVEILSDDTLIFDYVFTRYNFSDEVFTDWEISFIELLEEDNEDLVKEKNNNNSRKNQKNKTKNTNKKNNILPLDEEKEMINPINIDNNNNINKSEYINIYVTPITFESEKGYFSTSTNILPLTYSKVFCMNQKAQIKDLSIEIFKYFRRSMDDMIKHDQDGNVDDSYYNNFYENLNDVNFIENEYNKCNTEKEKLFDIYIYHNQNEDTKEYNPNSWFNYLFNFGNKCEFCNKSYNKFCKLSLDYSTPLKELSNLQKRKRDIFLLVDFTKFKNNFKGFYSQFIDEADSRMSLSGDTNLYDCFDLFKKEEKLTKEKNYECPYCSRKIVPFQQLDLYKSPTYLILNIKRFKKKFEDLMDMINNKKNETFVNYPIDNFDLTYYFQGEKNAKDEKNTLIYDLCSIICHKGPIKNGHYYSIVKNMDKWYSIDETVITELETVDQVVTKDAFVLIYLKRENLEENNKKKIDDEDVLNIGSVNDVKDKDFGEMADI